MIPLEEKSAIAASAAPSVLTQNTLFSRMMGVIWLFRLRQTSTVGGESETEATAVAVKPARPAAPDVVMMWTAAPSRLIASRNIAGSAIGAPGSAAAAAACSRSQTLTGELSIQLI